MAENLIFNIVEQNLIGMIGATRIHCHAVSGGRAGSTTKGAENYFLANNALATGVAKAPYNYGPLPQGLYYMKPHESNIHKVRLDPFDKNAVFGRADFEIHGHGPKGSFGCIVPNDFFDLVNICTAVRTYVGKYKVKPVLRVIAVGDIGWKSFTA